MGSLAERRDVHQHGGAPRSRRHEEPGHRFDDQAPRDYTAGTMKKKKAKKKTVEQRAASLVRFIDAHGGKLGAFRGYGVAQPPPQPSPK